MKKIKLKYCPKCSYNKDIKCFGIRKSNGRPRSFCNECEREYNKKRRDINTFNRIKNAPIISDLKGEKWKDMIGHEGCYKISNKGRVKGLKRTITRKDGTKYIINETIISLKPDIRGHLMFGVSKNCKQTPKRVHREVAKLFVPNPLNLPDVKHINGNKNDNRPENLKWFDSREIVIGKQKEIEKEQRKKNREEYKSSMLDTIKKFAIHRGGLCLSNTYVNLNSKLKFKCNNNHVWYAIPNTVLKRGSWCSMCNSTIGEDICRYVLEKAFKTSFNKIRPDWLSTKRGKLELDGYSEKLKIAFEYQGEQHYNPVKYYGSEKNNFKKQLERDRIKRSICKKNGVILLVFPFFKKMVNNDILKIISKELSRNSINTSILNRININDYYSTRQTNKNHNDILKIVNERGGKLFTIINSINDYAKFECEYGHKFTTKASHVKSGTWCRFCGYKIGSSKKTKTIKEAQDLAKQHGGKCLSKEYLGSRKRHIFQCKNGHTFKRYINELRLNGEKCWCKKCQK